MFEKILNEFSTPFYLYSEETIIAKTKLEKDHWCYIWADGSYWGFRDQKKIKYLTWSSKRIKTVGP